MGVRLLLALKLGVLSLVALLLVCLGTKILHLWVPHQFLVLHHLLLLELQRLPLECHQLLPLVVHHHLEVRA